MNNQNDRLRHALGSWRIEPQADPGFRVGVWSRIDRGRTGETWLLYLRRHATGVALALCLALAAGGLLGSMYAQQQVRRDRERLAWDYLASIDARYQADQMARQ